MNMQNLVRCFSWGAVLFLMAQSLHAQECTVSVNVATAKAVYAEEDLLAVNLTFSTTADRETLRLSYPTLQEPSGVFLDFLPTNGLTRSGNLLNSGGLSFPRGLLGGQLFKTEVFLQRYLDGFHVGHYDLPWKIKVPCEGKAKPVIAEGRLSFDVVSSKGGVGLEARLQGEYAGYVSRAQEFTGPDLFLQGESFRAREAIEALRLVRSPLVIPYLEQLAAAADHDARTGAFDGLIKFSMNDEAKRFVFQTLQSSDPRQIGEGLRVLSAWRVNLPEVDVRTLLIKGDPELQGQVLHYLGFSKNSEYSAIVDEYAKSSNQIVASQAKAAAAQLKVKR